MICHHLIPHYSLGCAARSGGKQRPLVLICRNVIGPIIVTVSMAPA